jgi:hypothetical protein
MVTKGIFSRGKPARAEVKKTQIYASTPPYIFMV